MSNLIAIIAMIVIGGVLAGVAGYYGSRAFSGSGTTTAISEAGDIWNNAQSVFGGTPASGPANFSSVTNGNAITGGIVPMAMTTGDGQTINGPWAGSTVTLSGSSDGQTFYEDWNNIPSTACAKFALSQKTNFVEVNSSGVWTGQNAGATASAIAAGCNQGTASVSEIKFSYVPLAGQ